MYHYNFYPTYMFYDSDLYSLNPICDNYLSEKKQQEEQSLLEKDDFMPLI